MQVTVYSFPSIRDGISSIEKVYLMLKSRYRSDGHLTREEIDYMDWANNVLMTSDSYSSQR